MKLEGVRVLDLSWFLPGPYVSTLLADHGADVTKIEPLHGDPGREVGLADGPSTVFFRTVNRGKKSVVLDLKSSADLAKVRELADKTDIVIEAFRPGVTERLGFGYEVLSRTNPGLIYCSISAFGQDGPYRNRPAHDLAVQATSGILAVTRGRDGQSTLPGLAASDILAALNGAVAVVMALHRRHTTGKGDYIDISMQAATVAAMVNLVGPLFAEDREPVWTEQRTTGGAAFYRIYNTADGRQVVLGGQEQKFVESVLSALGRMDLAPLCARGPGPHQTEVIRVLEEKFGTMTQEESLAWLDGLGVCCAPVNSVREAFSDVNLLATGAVFKDDTGRRQIAPVARFRNEPSLPDYHEPALGSFQP
jgi:crotonobetainyl-CoA:carnitine CoA-transferase CaiB-like acyl-CoA transferase